MPIISQITPFSKPLAAFLGIAVVALTFSTGCSEGEDQAQARVSTYEVRGIIEALSAAGPPPSDMMIRHEAIPHFVNQHGVEVGMKTMSMPFPATETLDLSNLNPGDKVKFTFDVTWGGIDSGWVLTEIERLPADTELNLGGPDAGSHDHSDHSGHDH